MSSSQSEGQGEGDDNQAYEDCHDGHSLSQIRPTLGIVFILLLYGPYRQHWKRNIGHVVENRKEYGTHTLQTATKLLETC